MKFDTVACAYLLEMARYIGPSYSRHESFKGVRNTLYNEGKAFSVFKDMGNGVKMHKHVVDDCTHYYTLNHNNNESLHISHIKKHNATSTTPFAYEEQHIVDRVKSTDILPKGHASSVVYDHFKNSDYPLRSSYEQYKTGHKMWSGLVDKALDDGHHAYHYEESNKHLTPINHDNKQEMIGKSFGEGDAFEHKHLVISKTPLTTNINEAKKEEPVFDLDDRKLPYVDISHHHPRKHLQEGQLIDWINKTQPVDHEISSFTLSRHPAEHLSGPTYETPDEHHELAEQHASTLSDHHYYSVDAYITGGLDDGHETGSKYVNDHLINAHKMKKQPKKEFSFGDDPDYQKVLQLDHLDDALNKNKLEKQLTTYSGIGFHPKSLMKEDNLLHLPAYTSSSTNRAVSLMYAKPDNDGIRHIMEIKHPKGSNGLYLGDNEDFTPFMQKEHIMPRNSTIKVNPEPEVHMDNMGNKIHVWKATRVLRKEDKE